MNTKRYNKFVATAATASLVASAIVPVVHAETAKTSFKDVSDRYIDAVSYLVDNNITAGISSTEYGTALNIKRVDVAVMLAKATLTKEEIESAPASGFKDVPARAVKYVNALKAKGIVNGKTTTTFGADASITRGEAALMLSKAYGIQGDVANVDFDDVAPRYKEAVAALVDYQITSGKGDNKFGTTDSIKRGELAIFLYKLENLNVSQALKVESVTALNGVQLQVNFTQAVDAASLFDNGVDGAFKADTVKVTTLSATPAGALKGELSADGKTLVITSTNQLEGNYAVTINNLTSKEGIAFDKFESIMKVEKDVTAPTIVGSEQLNAYQVKVKFSEPMQAFANVAFTLKDGTAVTANIAGSIEAGATEMIITMDEAFAVTEEITASFIGAKDMAGNLIATNPATVLFKKGLKDGVAPTVSTIQQTGAKQFVVNFSEELYKKPVVTVSNFTVASIEKDAKNPTQYVVTTNELLDEAQTVKVSGLKDLSGEDGTDFSKIVTFAKDTVAAKVASTNVVTDSQDKKEYLEFTFDKDVELAGGAVVSATGKYLKDYVTTTGVTITNKAIAYKDNSSKKVVRIALTDLLTGTDVKDAAYTLDFTFTGVATATGVATETAKATFTRTEDGVQENTNVVKVNSIAQVADDNNKIEVTFSEKVDGASAITLANYSIQDAVVASVQLKPAEVDGTQVAVLTLEAGSNNYTGVRNIKISNVKALGSTKTMETYTTNSVSLKENVAPTVVSAKLLSTTEIELTFSENVMDAAGIDFEVLANGKSRATENKVDVGIGGTAAKTAKITVNVITSEELASGISLKALTTLDVKDAARNKLTVAKDVVVAQ